MEGIKKLMLKNQLLSQALIFFFMLFLTTFLFSLILKLVLPFLFAFLLTRWFYKWFIAEKSETEWVSFFSSTQKKKNNIFYWTKKNPIISSMIFLNISKNTKWNLSCSTLGIDISGTGVYIVSHRTYIEKGQW